MTNYMKQQEAIEICKEMQKWRRGEGLYDGESPAPMPYTPEKFGMAIDKLIDCAEEHNTDELRKERDAYYERLQELRAEKAEFVEKACKYLDTHILCMQDETRSFFIENFCKAMTDFADTDKIADHFREATKKVVGANSCNPGKNLQELTWQDVEKIVEIADALIQTAHDRVKWEYKSKEDYYKEVLRRYREEQI